MQLRKGWWIAALMSSAALAQTGVGTASAPRADAAWARPTVAGQGSGGGYVRIVGGSMADRLLGASAPVAQSVELHTMEMQGDVMRMRQMPDQAVPAGAEVAFQPGGKHLMLLGLKQPLKAGTRFPLTLRFEKAGEVTVQMQVTTQPPVAEATAPHKH